MKDNTQFPNPTPSLADVENAFESFSTALSKAGGGERVMVAVKDNHQAILLQMLTELAYYVTHICKGDKALLLSSGFDISGDKVKSQKAPPKLQAELGLPGQVTTKVTRISQARSYVHQYTADPLTLQSVWISETTLSPTHTFVGLESAARIWFRVIVLGKNGEPIYWDPILRIVQ
jgi:hypothetical protein